MVYRTVRDHTEGGEANPLPIYDILIHRCRLEFDFLAKVEDLKGSLVRLERDDLPLPVHNRTIGLDRAPGDLIVILEIDDNDFRVGIFGELLTDADIVIGLKSLSKRLAI